MSLVYSGVLSHAPGITGRDHLCENAEKRDELHAALDRQRKEIEASGAEALIVMAAEHFANFFMNCLYFTGLSLRAKAMTPSVFTFMLC